jgi:hypothetical protein
MVVRVPTLALFTVGWLLPHAPSTRAQSCPANSSKIAGSRAGTKITLACRRGDGFWPRSGPCVPRDLALKQSQPEIQLIALGARGEALKQRDELDKCSLGRKLVAHRTEPFPARHKVCGPGPVQSSTAISRRPHFICRDRLKLKKTNGKQQYAG